MSLVLWSLLGELHRVCIRCDGICCRETCLSSFQLILPCHYLCSISITAVKRDSCGAGIVHSVCRILRPVIDPLDVRAHATVLSHSGILVVVIVLATLVVAALRQVLCARVTRNSVLGGSCDDVAGE